MPLQMVERLTPSSVNGPSSRNGMRPNGRQSMPSGTRPPNSAIPISAAWTNL